MIKHLFAALYVIKSFPLDHLMIDVAAVVDPYMLYFFAPITNNFHASTVRISWLGSKYLYNRTLTNQKAD